MSSLASPSTPSPLNRWWGPGLLMASVIGILIAADFTLNGLLNHFPWWIIVCAIVGPWTLPLLSLARRAWREAAIRAISLAFGTSLGMAGLALAVTSYDRPPPHPFPKSLEQVATTGTPIQEPADSDAALPPASNRPCLTLRKGFQGGIYKADIHANPGEPGFLFLRAFEPITNTPLSEDSPDLTRRISSKTRHPALHSNNPNEQFTSEAEFKIMEGDWNQFYAARIELWFAPESGIPPRLIHSGVFRVEGWQR